MQEQQVQRLVRKDPLEKEMAPHPSPLTHGQRSLAGYSPWVTVGHKLATEHMPTLHRTILCFPALCTLTSVGLVTKCEVLDLAVVGGGPPDN